MHALGILFPGAAAVRREVTAATAAVNLPIPLAFWRFEEASGTRVDSTGNGNDLASTGTINSASGLIGNGASLPNNNGIYLDRASNSTLAPNGISNDYAMGVWFKRTGGVVGLPLVVASKWGYSGFANRPFRLQIDAGTSNTHADLLVNPGTLGAGTTGNLANGSGVDFSDGAWHSILWWYDHTGNTLNIQTDGGTVDSLACNGGINAGASTNFRVSGDFAFDVCLGVVDNLSLWHVAMTSGNRTAWHNVGAGHEWVSGAWV